MDKNIKEKAAKTPKEAETADAYDWIQCVVTALIACILIFTFFARTVGVVSVSMQPTLVEGDRLIISRLFYTPRYGDIVVIQKDSFASYPIIKRVIATEGQTVSIDFDAGVVYVDDVALREPYVNSPTYEPEDFTRPVTVPEGCVFVMGDNRNRSTDSRTSSIGCVDTRCILGKALWRITPLNKFGGLYRSLQGAGAA
ncbi:MAG: signal peptidase I [Oscillospiraceae bacterium]|nr:signal peptidase I [Oscillospiraceae bacterium]